jgi:hypothetical protein
MELLESLEARWFMTRVQSAAELQKWFASTPDEGERTDHYLITNCNDLSFKARLEAGKPAKVEMKHLVGSLGVLELAPLMVGELQRWTKLSLAINDPKLKQHGGWLEVKKTRYLRKFAVSMTPALVAKEVAAKTFVSRWLLGRTDSPRVPDRGHASRGVDVRPRGVRAEDAVA